MTSSIAFENGDFDVVTRQPSAIISDILVMVPAAQRHDIHGLLKPMNVIELRNAFDRAVAARAKAGQSVTDKDVAAAKAILAMPHLVQS